MAKAPPVTIERLAWTDPELGTIPAPRRPMRIRAGFGSGLAVRAGDPPGRIWAVCDRGPNLGVKTAVELYGLAGLEPLREVDGAKIMPRADLGPALAELQVEGGEVRLIRTMRLTTAEGRPIPGAPMAGGAHSACEPAFDLEGQPLPPELDGADSEGVVATRDGGFWVGDEYGPSLLRLDAQGRLIRRLVPAGPAEAGASAADPVLPALAARRQVNRGFEALALSDDEASLFLAFQSPLAHPDVTAHKAGRHVRLWELDNETGRVAAQYAYELDPPESFRRDCAAGPFERSDIKVGELTRAGEGSLLVLERGSHSSKIYRVRLDPTCVLPPEHLKMETRPTLEELSAGADFPLPVLAKELLLSTDDHPQVSPDLEGMTLLSPTELLLVTDNDFGLEGAETTFWRVRFPEPLT